MAKEIRCKECGGLWEKHQHFYYNLVKETVGEEDATVANMIKSNCGKKSCMEKAIAKLDLQEGTNNTMARFGTFLKRNGIIPHKKYVEKYVHMQIELANKTNDAGKVANLKKMIAAYREQSKIIEQHLDKSKETIDLANIEKSIQMLVALKVNGKSIDELYQAEQMRQQQQNLVEEALRCPLNDNMAIVVKKVRHLMRH